MFKLCVVPSCDNDNDNHPEKLFLTIPKNAKRRENWAAAINVKHIPMDAKYRVCEDHFNLSLDSTNWLYYSMMGSANLMLKHDVVPHKYITSPSKHDLGSQLKRSITNTWVEGSSTSKKIRLSSQEATKKENIPVLFKERDGPHLSESVRVKQSCRTVAIQTDIKTPCRSVKTNTEPIEMKTCGTLTVMPVICVMHNKTKHIKESSSETISQSTSNENLLQPSSSDGEESEKVQNEILRKSTTKLIVIFNP